MPKPQAAPPASSTAVSEWPATPARSCAAVACSTTSMPAITMREPGGGRDRDVLAERDARERGERAVDGRAPSATTETAPRPIAAYENVSPTHTPTPPTAIHASERAGGLRGHALPDRHRQHEDEADHLHPGERLQRADQARRAVVAGRRDAPRRCRAQRGHDHEHQEMVPVAASTSTSAPTTTR